MGMSCETSGEVDGVFASSWKEFRRHQVVVLPVDLDMRPLVSIPDCYRDLPSESTLNDWGRRFPNANIGILPGSSSLEIVDAKDNEQLVKAVNLCGTTPLKVRTSESIHLYYRPPGSGRCFPPPQGLKIIIGSRDIVIAPPSRNRDGSLFCTFEDGCSWDDLDNIPIIGKTAAQHPSEKEPAKKPVEEKTTSPWTGSCGVQRVSMDEIMLLASHSKHGGDAHLLLSFLRIKHAYNRSAFNITPRRMVEEKTIPRWTEERYQNALRMLVEVKLIERVAEFHIGLDGRRHGARYKLAAMMVSNKN